LKDQYVGDINDYRKYALLRALSAGGANRLGVCWMLTESDGGNHGGRLGYLEQPERYRHFDPQLFDALAHVAAEPEQRSVRVIEASGVLPGALFHSDLLPQSPDERARYMAECRERFAAADIVFFDPDNGIEVPSTRVGLKSALRYVFLEEIAAVYADGKAVLIYQHFPIRQHRAPFITARIAQLRAIPPDASVWAFTTAHVVFLLLVHPDSPERLALAAADACSRWHHSFVRGEQIDAASGND
jgi:hypothetical protein